ncbi:MAG: NRDE family protein [Flavobacterium sp.]|nr:NRDE family protein [Flavobacterium sp.]
MCTVSFVAAESGFVITSNRDEHVLRRALPPIAKTVNSKKIVFPQDPQSGGTWFVTRDDGATIVLLNGAAQKHVRKANYRRSRGLVVTDLIESEPILHCWDHLDLDNIEPFTIVLFENYKLYQLRWDGIAKDSIQLPTEKPHIWSSSPLYTETVREKRSRLFSEFMVQNPRITPGLMMDFHMNTEVHDEQNGLVINRQGVLKTLSITQAIIGKNEINLKHLDLVNDQMYDNNLGSNTLAT